jgi:hypothetical protein
LSVRAAFVLCLLCVSCYVAGGEASAGTPIRKYDAYGTLLKVEPASDTEKKAGVLAAVTIEGVKPRILITRKTTLRLQRGKVVYDATVEDLKGSLNRPLSVWFQGRPQGGNSPRVQAEGALLFLPKLPGDMPGG